MLAMQELEFVCLNCGINPRSEFSRAPACNQRLVFWYSLTPSAHTCASVANSVTYGNYQIFEHVMRLHCIRYVILVDGLIPSRYEVVFVSLPLLLPVIPGIKMDTRNSIYERDTTCHLTCTSVSVIVGFTSPFWHRFLS